MPFVSASLQCFVFHVRHGWLPNISETLSKESEIRLFNLPTRAPNLTRWNKEYGENAIAALEFNLHLTCCVLEMDEIELDLSSSLLAYI